MHHIIFNLKETVFLSKNRLLWNKNLLQIVGRVGVLSIFNPWKPFSGHKRKKRGVHMQFSGVYHRTSDAYSYTLDQDTLRINIKTGYEVDAVYLVYGDPFEAGILGGNWQWNGKELEVAEKKRLKHQLFWSVSVSPEFKRCKYYFKLKSNNTYYYFLEDGFYTEDEFIALGNGFSCFVFPWMNENDINKTPDWVNDTIWYQIFPERFENGDPSNDPDGVLEWGSPIKTHRDFYGGDLQGIINRLDHIEGLGVNGLYLTPICQSDSNHKYDINDYMKVDDHFGNNELFKSLVQKSHDKGIRVMVDGVFNHSGRKFAPWMDVLAHGEKSKYFNWFMVNQWPFDQEKWDTRDGSFYSFAFSARMPKLNTNNPEVVEYLLNVVAYWMKEFDVDGIRLDVANEISHEFCRDLRRMTKSLKPDFYILGEIWHDAMRWLQGDEFDAVMNYPFSNTVNRYWGDKKMSSDEFEYSMNEVFTRYMEQTNDVLFNLLDSHDTDRLINRVKDINQFYQELAVLFTMPGSPCIYYGTEIALEGAHDPDCRRCMPWDDIDKGKHNESIGIVKELISLRRNYSALRDKRYSFKKEYQEDRVIHYVKYDEFESIEVILNCSNKPLAINMKGKPLFSHGFTNQLLQTDGIYVQLIEN